FFFSSRRRHTISTRDWSSDVCSSDLRTALIQMEQNLGLESGTIFSVYPRELPGFAVDPDNFRLTIGERQQAFDNYPELEMPPVKIGRASCRGREYILVV